jgi:hypothetical protein
VMSDEVFSHDGRINLPPPTDEALTQAAEDVLGPTASEALLMDGGKVFRGMGGFFLQGPEECAGVMLPQAERILQDRLMEEAQKVRQAHAEEEGGQYVDPSRNPLIKIPD